MTVVNGYSYQDITAEQLRDTDAHDYAVLSIAQPSHVDQIIVVVTNTHNQEIKVRLMGAQDTDPTMASDAIDEEVTLAAGNVTKQVKVIVTDAKWRYARIQAQATVAPGSGVFTAFTVARRKRR